MYRRRLINREKVAFGFDSFLDLVANVIGIIIRLILVAWVGGRSYTSLMRFVDSTPTGNLPALAVPRRDDDPLAKQIDDTQRDLEAARARLLAQLHQVDVVKKQEMDVQIERAAVAKARADLAAKELDVQQAGSEKEKTARLVSLSLEEMRKRREELQAKLKVLEAQPAPTKALRYRTPVSQTVQADEVFFECKGGRIAYIDIAALLHEVRSGLDDKVESLRTTFQLTEATRPVGAFRLKYVVERERDNLDAVAGSGKPRTSTNFRYGISEWVVDPIVADRGEPLARALEPGSAFRRLADSLDGSTVITFWVYPDSFELFRTLRDHLYERGLEVAGRPLPEGAPIAASRNGSASRGQ